MQKKWLGLVALCLSAAAGCSEDQRVRFAHLRDGDYVGGLALIQIETDPGLRAVAAQLFVDGQLATTEIVAPFDLRLDANPFSEKKHRLTLRVVLDDGDVLEDEVTVTFDNTAPVIRDLPIQMKADASVALPITDNFGIALFEVESSLDPTNIKSSTDGANVIWPAGCGLATVEVRAVDLAGNLSERTFTITNSDDLDRDCDGFRAAPVGADCDDFRKWIFPGAPEIIEGFDFSCDGQVARRDGDGADFDGDGVLSISDGGDDCDDGDATVHGGLMRHRVLPLLRDGAPLTWQPGEGLPRTEALYLSRGGVIERVVPDVVGGDATITQLATGANPRSFDVTSSLLIYGRGTEIVLVDAATGAPRSSFDTGGAVGSLSYRTNFSDGGGTLEQVLYQSGGKLWSATKPVAAAGPWNQRAVVDVAEPLLDRPQGLVYSDSAQVYLRTATRTWSVYFGPNGVSEGIVNVAPANITAALSAAELSNLGTMILGVTKANGGHSLQSWSGSYLRDELAFPAPITAIYAHGAGFVVQLADGRAFIVRHQPRLRVAQTLSTINGPITGGTSAALTSAGWFYRSENSIAPAFSPNTDKDYDCDGNRSLP